MSEYRIQLDVFDGPLDLLLYLVRKEEVDIYDIPIARITAQYLAYIDMLKSLDLDVAGDFLVMAATLMEIKSAMLLPPAQTEQDSPTDTALDPRSELVRQLLEYKRIKDAANLLDASAQERQLRFSRPPSILERLKPEQEPQLDLDQISIWTLLETFDQILRSVGKISQYSQIQDDTPIDLYQIEILDRLQKEGPMSMQKIFEGKTNRLVLIGLFLGLLELIRNRLVWAEQPEAQGPIFLKPLTSEPAEQAVQKAIYSNPPADNTPAAQANEETVAPETQIEKENTDANAPQAEDLQDDKDDFAATLKEIKEVSLNLNDPELTAQDTETDITAQMPRRAPIPIQSIDAPSALSSEDVQKAIDRLQGHE